MGDCSRDGRVTIDELVRAVAVALQQQAVSACEAADGDGDGLVRIDELVRAVGNALFGCDRGVTAALRPAPGSRTAGTVQATGAEAPGLCSAPAAASAPGELRFGSAPEAGVVRHSANPPRSEAAIARATSTFLYQPM